MKKDIDDKMAKSIIQNLVDKELHRSNDYDMVKEFARGFERVNPEAPLIPESMFRELLELQKDTKLFVREIVRAAIRRFLDGDRSEKDDRCVYVNGEKWPWPLPGY